MLVGSYYFLKDDFDFVDFIEKKLNIKENNKPLSDSDSESKKTYDIDNLTALTLEDTSSYTNEEKMRIICGNSDHPLDEKMRITSRFYDYTCDKKKINFKTESSDVTIEDSYYDIFNLYSDSNKLKIYDARSNKSYIIENISTDKYYYKLLVDEITNELIGVSYQLDKDEDNREFFSFTLNKNIYGNKYTNFEILSNKYMLGISEDCSTGYCISSNELLNPYKEQIFKIGIFGTLSKGNIIYFITKVQDDDNIFRSTIYTEDFKIIAEGVQSDLISIDDNGLLYAYNEGKIICWDKNGKVIKTNSDYEEVLMFIDQYFLTIKDKELVLATIDGIVATYDEWNSKKMELYDFNSGWVKDKDYEGIFIVVYDDRVESDDVLKYCKKYGCNEAAKAMITEPGNAGFGYEYYYIPTTGEKGRITTVITGFYAFPK